MKGLLYKDFRLLNSYKKSLLLFLIVFTIVGITNKSYYSFLPILFLMISYMATIATFSYDEQAKWDRFALTLPLNKKDIVKEKYILYILLTLLGSLISIIFIGGLSYFQPEISVGNLFFTVLGAAGGLMLMVSIQFPCLYKFGIEKGRIMIFVIALLLGLAGGLLAYGFDKVKMLITIPASYENLAIVLTSILIPIVLLLVYYFSYRISYKIFKKKEF